MNIPELGEENEVLLNYSKITRYLGITLEKKKPRMMIKSQIKKNNQIAWLIFPRIIPNKQLIFPIKTWVSGQTKTRKKNNNSITNKAQSSITIYSPPVLTVSGNVVEIHPMKIIYSVKMSSRVLITMGNGLEKKAKNREFQWTSSTTIP